MFRTFCVAASVIFCLEASLALVPSARGAVTIDSILLESEAIAGEDIDSFSESTFGFYNAIATYSVGLAEDYLASGVVSAEFFQDALGPTLGLQLDALATAFTRPGSNYFASVTASATIDFTASVDANLMILDPVVGVVLTRISDSMPMTLADGALLPAGSYRLSAQINASPTPEGDATDAAAALITIREVPEPTTGAMLLVSMGALLGRRQRGDRL